MSEITDYVDEVYPQYMERIRYGVSEGDLDVNQPSETDVVWGRRLALGSEAARVSITQLLSAVRQARQNRWLDGGPLLKDPTEAGQVQSPDGMTQMECMHFVRKFLADERALKDVDGLPKLAGVAKALYLDPSLPADGV